MVTISDVAKRAGVSAASVSRHMSGGTVGGADRIAAAIAELRYRPNQSARGLRSGRHGCVGVIVPDITNPLFASLVNGIESALAGDDIRVLLANSNEDPARELALVADLASRTDGPDPHSRRWRPTPCLTSRPSPGSPWCWWTAPSRRAPTSTSSSSTTDRAHGLLPST